MKRIFIFLIFVFLILLPFTAADVVVRGKDYTRDSSGGNSRTYGAFVMGPGHSRVYNNPYPVGSAVYNYQKTGVEAGWSPYYVRTTSSSGERINSHIMLNGPLAETVFRNPSILDVRGMENNQRFYRGIDRFGGNARDYGYGSFNLFHARNQVTGRIRTNVKCTFC